jgi:hypothetical protein
MKKILAILSLIFLASASVTKPISQNIATLGGVTAAAVVTCLAHDYFKNEQRKVRRSENSAIDYDTERFVRSEYKSTFYSRHPKLAAIVAGIIAGCVSYKFLEPAA